jgi:hypothetical protein|tara:strand:+ start:264 stop:572 length:309 start_codon:yes stop_codon:yes gene_type:complete
MLTPNLSHKSRQVREEFFPDFAISYSDSQIRGTFADGKYYFKIYKLLWHIYINIAETEHDLHDVKPINIASYGFDIKGDKIKTKIDIEEILIMMDWDKCDWC